MSVYIQALNNLPLKVALDTQSIVSALPQLIIPIAKRYFQKGVQLKYSVIVKAYINCIHLHTAKAFVHGFYRGFPWADSSQSICLCCSAR